MLAVKGFFPKGTLVIIRGGFHKHRDARTYMLKREGEFRARFGVKLFVGAE